MKTIKRSDIYKALRTEPLRAGNWIQVDREKRNEAAKNIKDCKVCAVGAILRHNTEMTAFKLDFYCWNKIWNGSQGRVNSDSTENDVLRHLENGNYLAALSAYFESTIPEKGRYGKKHRERLVRFVKDNFPKEIEI